MYVVQVLLRVKPENVDQVKAALLENARASVFEVGVIRFDVFQDENDPAHFCLVEIYRDKEAQASHYETEHFKKWRAVAAELDPILERRFFLWNNLYPESSQFAYPTPVWAVPEVVQLTRDAVVSLREITEENIRNVAYLSVDAFQRKFVADNVRSIMQGSREPKAWFRAIYADETPVGFVMNLEDPDKPLYYLWRYMIDHHYQGMGFGKRALEQVIARLKTLPNAREYFLSYVPGPGCPRDFYARLGFVETGNEDEDGEVEMRLDLTA